MLSIIGCGLIPLLSIQLHPSKQGNSLNVNYAWPGISSSILEKEVTSPLEGILSSINGLAKISSSSSKGRGSIRLIFKEETDMDAVRFEVGSLLRSIYPKLPKGLSRPSVRGRSGRESNRQLLMTYTLNGEGSSLSLQQYVNDHIVNVLGLLEQVDQVKATGAVPFEYEVSYDPDQIANVKLNASDLGASINRVLQRKELGGGIYKQANDSSFIFLSYVGNPNQDLLWDQIVLTNTQGRIYRLTDLAKIRLKEQKPRSYFRINGLNTIYLNIYTTGEANQLQVARQVKDEMARLQANFPPNFSLLLSYDASERLKGEIQKILMRSGMAIVILLLFVLIISRQWRYLTIIGVSLLANLAIAVIFYYLFKVEIHLYSLAGITVSLGIIIDNTIIMVDHVRHYKNNRVFLALLAATLTTMGALSIIFFLNEKQQTNLVDFAMVMLVNLAVSLFIAFFFIPSLMDKIKLRKPGGGRYIKQKRGVVKVSNSYRRFIVWGQSYKWLFIVIAVWGFGIPFFLLPNKLGDERRGKNELSLWQQYYDESLGNTFFVSEVKPWMNKIFGGSLYYFTSYMADQNMNMDNQRTQLTVIISMPDGATLHQMNTVFIDLENYLAGFDEIERFISRVNSIDRSSIQIFFKEEHENSSFPYYLKQLLETRAVETGGADFVINGVGRGFNNRLRERRSNSSISLFGYNFDELVRYARVLKEKLLKNKRVEKVVIHTGNSRYAKPRYEYLADVDIYGISKKGATLGDMFNGLSKNCLDETRVGSWAHEKDLIPIVLRPFSRKSSGLWQVLNTPVKSKNGQYFRLKEVADIKKERAGGSINKINQQYNLTVTYDFIGPYILSNRVLERNIKEIDNYLPLGFTVKRGFNGKRWNHSEKKQYWLLFLVIAIVYFICAILLESLVQPLAIIATLPISFIGVFLTFTLFKIPFNQGGYASMVLLCGLTVNSALYIINDYNNRLSYFAGERINHYLKAYNHKIVPILLTVLSTSLGLIPFLLGGQQEGFWFSLAAGAIGGLIFSLLAIVIWLPLFMLLNGKSNDYKVVSG